MTAPLTPARLRMMVGVLLLLLIITFAAGLLLGTESITANEMFRIVWDKMAGRARPVELATKETILFDVRFPRVLLAAVVGCGLAVSGAVFQVLLRNVLADPYILGVSSGTAFGIVVYTLLGSGFASLGDLATPVAGFIGGFATTLVIFRMAYRKGALPASGLLLSGVVLNAILSAAILAITFVVDPGRMFGLVYWLLGTVTPIGGWSLLISILLVLTVTLFFIRQAPRLNLLSLGEEPARALGLDPERFKIVLLFGVALLMGIVVSLSGLIGFVGIMIPHVFRMRFGPDHRLLLPCAAIGGAAFLVLADTAARTVLSPTEMPVGILTALCGGPFFLYILRSTRGHWIPK